MAADRRSGIFWALGAALGGGAFLVPWKLANEGADSSNSAFALLAFAAVFNTMLMLAGRRRPPRTRRPLARYELGVAVVLAVLSLLGNLASAAAITTLSASVLTVLLRGDMMVAALLGWVILRERVERRFWFGAAVAVIGVLVLYDPRGDAQIDLRGSALALGAVVCFSLMAVVTRGAIHRVDPVRLNATRLWMTLPLWIVLSRGFSSLSSMEADRLGWIALAAFLGPFLARLCLIMSSRHVEVRVTSLVALASPLVTIPLDLLFLGHVPTANEVMGGSILIAGIAIPLLRFGRARPKGGADVPADSLRDARD